MTEQTIQRAIQLAKIGDIVSARNLIEGVVRSQPQNARAWYILSQLCETNEQSMDCLRRVLEIDQGNTQAHDRLAKLQISHVVKIQPPVQDNKLTQTNNNKSPFVLFISAIAAVVLCSVILAISGLYLYRETEQLNHEIANTILTVQPTENPGIVRLKTIAAAPSITPTPTYNIVLTPIHATEIKLETPTKAPDLTSVPIDNIIILSGDLPSTHIAGQISHQLPSMFREIPSPQSQFHREIALLSTGRIAGGVSIVLYNNPEDLGAAYQIILSGMDDESLLTQNIVNIGDRAFVSVLPPGLPIISGELLFARCSAIVHIRISDLSRGREAEQVKAYADRLDKRLIPIICK